MNSLVVLTDRGSVQEEACTLKIPTLTLRYNTERPETVLVGVNRVIGTETQKIVEETIKVINSRHQIVGNAEGVPNPLGDGRAGERIAMVLSNAVEGDIRVEAIDSRENPYITYALLELHDIGEIAKNIGDIVALYDDRGTSISDLSKARKIVIRSPRSGAISK